MQPAVAHRLGQQNYIDRYPKSTIFLLLLPLPWSRQLSGRFRVAACRHPLRSRSSAFLPERLGRLCLTRIARGFLDLARQNLGDAYRIGESVRGSCLALRSLRHADSGALYAKHLGEYATHHQRIRGHHANQRDEAHR